MNFESTKFDVTLKNDLTWHVKRHEATYVFDKLYITL